MCKRIILLILIFRTVTLESQTERWNLEKCIQEGIDKNLNLKLTELNLRNSELAIKESKFQQLPNLGANLNSGLSIGQNIDPTTNGFVSQNILFGNYGISASVLLFQAGQIRNTIKQNEILFDASKKDYEQAINDFSLQVAVQYLNVLLSEERLSIAKKSFQTASMQSKQLQRLVDIGSRANADALEMKSQEAKAEQSIILAENVLEQAKLQLKQLIRVNSNTNLELEKIQDSEFRNIQNESYTSENLFDIAEKNQAIIQAAVLRVNAAETQEKIAKSRYYPSITGFANVDSRYSNAAVVPSEFGIRTETLTGTVNGTPLSFEYEVPTITKTTVISFGDQFNQFLGYRFGLAANIPIFNNYSTTASVKRSQIQSLEAKINLENQKESLKLQIVQAVANVKSAVKELEAAKKSDELARLVYENTTKKYEIGTANSFELNASKNSAESSENSLIIAKYDLLFKQKVLDLYAGKKIK